jgi:eukaryotic-like serine/threonine-protein kinase
VPAAQPAKRPISFGPFELDGARGELRKRGVRVKLQDQPFQILQTLLEHPGEIVTREELRSRIWPADTFVDFDKGLYNAVKKLREALGDTATTPRFIETVPKRGYRIIAPVNDDGSLAPMPVPFPTPAPAGVEPAAQPSAFHWKLFALALLLAALAAVGIRYWIIPPLTKTALNEKDTIVLADFVNATGDPVFDGTLRQGLSAQLEQSPFLNLLSEDRTAETLALMGRAKNTPLTYDLAREVCQRTGSTITLQGSISRLGNQYVVGLEALNCNDGSALAEEQVTASSKERVLKSLGDATTAMRKKLGESLASIQRYDAPLEKVTTPSLDALQAYSLGFHAMTVGDDYVAAVAQMRRAVTYDPNFAMAYSMMAASYTNLGEDKQAAESTRRAYELRERVSERERFSIALRYEMLVTKNLYAARKSCELWRQTYPRDDLAPRDLTVIYAILGDYPKTLTAAREALELDHGSGINYGNLVSANVLLNRLEDAKAIAREAQARKLDSPFVHESLYQIDFLQHDLAAADREAAGLMGKTGWEDVILYFQSDTAAFAGHFVQARELTQRAIDSALRADEQEQAAGYEAESALREALVGNTVRARQQGLSALARSRGEDVEAMAATALGLAGDAIRARRLADDLAKRFPLGTVVQSEYLPLIRAAAALGDQHDRKAPAAVELLGQALTYELGSLAPASVSFNMYPVYLRGEAFLGMHRGAEAADEFQKILDHPGVVINEPIAALAHLGFARACGWRAHSAKGQEAAALHAKALTAYQDFLSLWKDADPDLPILKQAKLEYAQLQ